MSELLATYKCGGQHHRVELVPVPEGGLVLDRSERDGVRVVAELTPGEGREQALATLHGDGAYLERARAGEPGLCRQLDSLGTQARAA